MSHIWVTYDANATFICVIKVFHVLQDVIIRYLRPDYRYNTNRNSSEMPLTNTDFPPQKKKLNQSINDPINQPINFIITH